MKAALAKAAAVDEEWKEFQRPAAIAAGALTLLMQKRISFVGDQGKPDHEIEHARRVRWRRQQQRIYPDRVSQSASDKGGSYQPGAVEHAANGYQVIERHVRSYTFPRTISRSGADIRSHHVLPTPQSPRTAPGFV
jgi:hypothetical protein